MARLRITGGALLIALSLATAHNGHAAGTDSIARMAATCASCHGPDGASPGESIPIIGGQTAQYLGSALQGFKADQRGSYIMTFIANGFSDDQLSDLANHFSHQAWQATETAFDAEKAAKGATPAANVCASCHGTDGEGTMVGPRIAGEPALYLEDAMNAYLDGRRSGNGTETMRQVLAALPGGERDIENLANYYAGKR